MDSVRNGFVQNIISPKTKTLLGHFKWALSNILRDSSHRDIVETKCFVRPLVRILEESSRDNVQLRLDVCYCLQYLAEGNVEDGSRPQLLIDFFKVLPTLNKVLQDEVTSKCPTPKLLVRLTRCFGMIASGNAMQTDLLLSTGILDFIVPLVHVKNKAVVNETMWLLSNIAGGTKDQAEAPAKRSRILREFVKASHSDNWATRKEGLWTLCNLLSNNSPTQTIAVVSAGAILPFSASLQISESDLLISILDSLYRMLVYDANQPNNNMPTVIEEEGGLDAIEALLNHRNDQVYEKVLKIIEDHFGTEPDLAEEDPNAGPKLFRAFALCKEFVSCGLFSHWRGWKLKGRLLNVGRCCVSLLFRSAAMTAMPTNMPMEFAVIESTRNNQRQKFCLWSSRHTLVVSLQAQF